MTFYNLIIEKYNIHDVKIRRKSTIYMQIIFYYIKLININNVEN